jgi:hypothetical protein
MITHKRRYAAAGAIALLWAAACTGEHPDGTAFIIIQPCFGPGHAGVKQTPTIKLAVTQDGKTVRTRQVRAPYGMKISLPEAGYTIKAIGPETTEVIPDTATVKVRGHHTTVVRIGQPCI